MKECVWLPLIAVKDIGAKKKQYLDGVLRSTHDKIYI